MVDAEPLGDVDGHHEKHDRRKDLGETDDDGIRAAVQRAGQQDHGNGGSDVQEESQNAVVDGGMDDRPVCLLLVFFAPAPYAAPLQEDRTLGNLDVNVGWLQVLLLLTVSMTTMDFLCWFGLLCTVWFVEVSICVCVSIVIGIVRWLF